MRQIYGCDCEGPVQPFEGGEPSDPAGKHVLHSVLAQCETILSDKPPTCPWRALEDPAVRDVIEAYRSCATGMGAATIVLRQTNPPRYVWQGVQHYAHCLNLLRDWDDEQRKKNPPKPR